MTMSTFVSMTSLISPAKRVWFFHVASQQSCPLRASSLTVSSLVQGSQVSKSHVATVNYQVWLASGCDATNNPQQLRHYVETRAFCVFAQSAKSAGVRS